MCVLCVADKRRPTEDEMDKMATTNPDGIGIAYRDKDVVKWEKGLTLAEVLPLAHDVPLPFVIHFRIASCGGKTKEMTHPFPVEKDVRTDLSGQTRGFVLFHNGHWGQYRDKGIDGAIKNRVKVPEGKWSDTRVMAWLAHLHGPNILELIDEKVILFGPNKIEIFHPDGWFRVNDLLVSNRIWEHNHTVYRAPYMADWDGGHDYSLECQMAACHKTKLTGSAYCGEHQPPCRLSTCAKPRAAGSDYCWEHKQECIRYDCKERRVEGQSYCAQHLPPLPDRRLEAPVNGNRVTPSVIEQPGGAAPTVPFRQGAQDVQDGGNQQTGVAPPPDGAREVAPQDPNGQVKGENSDMKAETFRRVAATFKSPWSKPIRPLDVETLPIM